MQIRAHNLGQYTLPEVVKGGVCVDVGANVGSFLHLNKNLFRKMHFYEPYYPCFEIACERTKKDPHIKGFCEAAYKEDGKTLDIVGHFNGDSGSNGMKTDSLNEHWTDALVGTANTVSLPTMFRRLNEVTIDYLKVDCETSEYYFLAGQDISNVRYIGIEMHWQMGQKKYEELLQHLFKTHVCSADCCHIEGSNKELLFSNIL